MDRPFSNMYHAPSVPLQSEGRIDPHNYWLQSADRIANHGAPESARSSRSHGATNPSGVASDARYSSPVLGRSLNHAPQFVPVISSTVTLMHPLARRLPSFPAFAQPLPVAIPVFQKSKEIPMSRPMRWTANQRRYTHFPSDPVSEAVRTTQSQRPTEFLGHAMPTSPIWSRFVKESAANTGAENRISPSLLPTPRKSSDHKDVYNEKLVNFAANSYRYSPLPSLMVGIERGMRGRIASSQQTIPNENDQRFLASTYSGQEPFTPVGLKAQSSLTNEILRPSDVELPTALPNPVQPRRDRDHFATQSIHHSLPITKLSPPRLRVREIAVEDPIKVKPCISLLESERAVQTGSFSARSPILHNLKTPTKGQVSGGTNCRNVPPSTDAQKDAQGSQASNDTIGSWSLDDDVLSYLKQK
ncbi:uncharacterized protein EI90DRAFT_3073511 [Cantharellus anzutake]|uniref:uncharacterized protein n=1 Tax=Cantharellus anzutake TaxID=1750568 RepID=UPI00190338C1|nr:uncharacterized protein EI90DRAFT_3073511 [Cantharellus anzutake]KAF8325237.1 hypothetical protein EI90DRAFT_3073511 [Cantharellus anzutake]